MEDIAPKLLKKIQYDFKNKFDNSKIIRELYRKVEQGNATYKEANEFAIEVGELLSGSFKKNLSSSVLPDGRMYYNIADRIIRDTLGNNYELVADISAKIQEILNKKAGIGIKAIKPKINEDKVRGIVDIVSGKEKYDDIAYMLGEPVVNFSQSVVNDAVRENADFQYKAGLSPKIIRTSTGKCCEWCDKLAGIYDYEAVSDTGNNVFRRHKYCRCLVEYAPGDGKRQNVHTKQWSKETKRDKIEKKKLPKENPEGKAKRVAEENRLDLASRIAGHPKMLKAYSPEGLKKTLENSGYDVKPLMGGSLKGIKFEDGGGYKVNFGGDGILQYHPEKNSHHNGAYYKISTGKEGRKRYDLEGEEKTD